MEQYLFGRCNIDCLAYPYSIIRITVTFVISLIYCCLRMKVFHGKFECQAQATRRSKYFQQFQSPPASTHKARKPFGQSLYRWLQFASLKLEPFAFPPQSNLPILPLH